MGDVIGTFGAFAIQSTADLALLEQALIADGIEDQALFGAITAHNDIFINDPASQVQLRDVIAKLLRHPLRKDYLLKARFRTGTLFASKKKAEKEIRRQLHKTSSEAVLLQGGGDVRLMGAGGKKHHPSGGPAYPVFNLEDFDGRPLQEMIDAARSFHTQASFLRPPGVSRFATRHQREEMEGIKSIHRRMVSLLELVEERLPLSEKGALVRLMHGKDQNVRNYLGQFLKHLEISLPDSGVGEVRREVEKIGRHGFSNPIDLIVESKAQDPRHQALIQTFLRDLAAEEIAIAVVSSVEIADGLPAFLPAVQRASDGQGKALSKDIASFILYAGTLAEETARINMARANVADLAGHVAKLKGVMDRLLTPHIAEINAEKVFARLGPEMSPRFLSRFPHGTTTFDRKTAQQYYDYFSRLSQRRVQPRADDYFPVVIAVPKEALIEGRIDLSQAKTIAMYVLKGDEERLKNLLRDEGRATLQRATLQRATLHPFLPFPEISLPGAPRTFLMNGLVLQFEIEIGILEQLLSGQGAEQDLDENGFPLKAIELTRLAHGHTTRCINEGVKDLQRQLAVRQDESDSNGWPLQRTLLSIRFMKDQSIPLETRAVFLNLYMGHVGPQVESFVDAILKRYEKEGTAELADLTRELFAGYFLYIPWGWSIMIEEGLKRELLWGINTLPPLEVREVPPEARKIAWQFVYASTHLMGISKEQAALLLRAVAFLPKGEDPQARHRRFVALSLLALPADAGAFEFLRNYRLAGDPGGVRLRYFLTRLDLRGSKEETTWRFKTALLRRASGYLQEIKSAEEELMAVARNLAGLDTVHLWDLADAVSLVTYSLTENLESKETILALKNIALALRGWQKLTQVGLNSKGEKRDDDPLMKEIKMLVEPSHFSDTLRALGKAFGSDLLAPPLRAFLNRQSGNLHALQYLLVAFHLKERLDQPESRLLQLLGEEKRLTELENPHGKIRNDQFLKYALQEIFKAHLAPAYFAMEMERRAMREFADEDAVAVVEVIPETWMESVVDFRIHNRNGKKFLVEVKTLRYDGSDFNNLLERLRDQVGKALWQLAAQRKSAGDAGNQDQIILYIQSPAGRPFTADEMKRLQSEAMQIIQRRSLDFVQIIRIESVAF